MLLRKSAALTILKPYQAHIVAAVRGGWHAWQKLPAETRKELTPTTRATFVRDFILAESAQGLETLPGVSRVVVGQLVVIRIEDQVLLRFKKMWHNGRAHNYPTQQQLDFCSQIPLPHVPQQPRLNVGYVLDPSQTAVSRVLASLPRGKKDVAWVTDLDVVSVKAPTPLPASLSRSAAPRMPRVHAKSGSSASKRTKTSKR